MYRVYRVESKDTLESIANKVGTSVESLREMNGLPNTYQVKIGEMIVVPLREETEENELYQVYYVQKGDTLYQIANENNIPLPELVAINGMDLDDYIYPNQELLIPKKGVKYIITEEGDTLETVAENINVTPMELVEQNKNIYLLPNQVIAYRNIGV